MKITTCGADGAGSKQHHQVTRWQSGERTAPLENRWAYIWRWRLLQALRCSGYSPSREVQAATPPAQVDSVTVFAVDRQQDGSMDQAGSGT